MADTVAQFEHVISICRDLFAKKLKDYGASWRILRPQSLTDQIFIKAKRIRSIETKGESKIDEGIRSEFIGIVNYGIIALIQLEKGYADTEDISVDEAIAEYEAHHYSSMRDGAIQRFEFCAELAWKTMREYLLDQGYTEINSPKAVIRQAYAHGMIADADGWVKLQTDRNLTSHVYDEAAAEAIFGRVEAIYLKLFDDALAYMKG